MGARNTSDDKYLLKLSAFFNNEYVFRHIFFKSEKDIVHMCLSKLIHELNSIGMTWRCSSRVLQSFIDSIIDCYFFIAYSDEYTIYSEDAQNRYINRINSIMELTKDEQDRLHDIVLDFCIDLKNKKYQSIRIEIEKLIEISLNYGVYATHLSTFRQKEYSLKNISESNIDLITENNFYKKNTTQKLNDSSLIVEPPHPTLFSDDVDKIEAQKDRSIAFFVDVSSEAFDSYAVIKKIEAILEFYAQKGQQPKSYLDLYYDKKLFRNVSSENNNKLLGLMMWDLVNFDNKEKPCAFIQASNDLYVKIKTDCDNKKCSEDCVDYDACFRSSCRLYDVAENSIRSACIMTSKS